MADNRKINEEIREIKRKLSFKQALTLPELKTYHRIRHNCSVDGKPSLLSPARNAKLRKEFVEDIWVTKEDIKKTIALFCNSCGNKINFGTYHRLGTILCKTCLNSKPYKKFMCNLKAAFPKQTKNGG